MERKLMHQQLIDHNRCKLNLPMFVQRAKRQRHQRAPLPLRVMGQSRQKQHHHQRQQQQIATCHMPNPVLVKKVQLLEPQTISTVVGFLKVGLRKD